MLVSSTILIALILTSPDPRGIILIPFFPLGLFTYIFGEKSGPNEYKNLSYLGYFVYLIIIPMILAISNRQWFYFGLGILAAILIMNVAGCHILIKGLGQSLH